MPPLRISSGRCFVVVALGVSLGAFAAGACQGPEAYYRGDAGGGLSGVAGATHVPGEEPSGTAGTGPIPTGVAGSQGRGGAGGMGRGGATGAAGMGSAGATATGRGGTTGVAGMGRGGTTGVAGMGRGGTTGVAGMGRGGATAIGRGGTTGVAGMGRGGAVGTGRGGITGTIDGGARDAAVDAGPRGGATGTTDGGPRDATVPADAGTGDGPVGTGPCAGLCSNPGTVRPMTASGDLGVEASCDEVVGDVTHLVCGNFVSPRTLKVNNVTVSCAGSGVTLPAPRNGGWCMQASAGQYSYAYFNTY